MAYNLKAGLMATNTMVGSAYAFTRTQAVEEEPRGPQNCSLAAKEQSGGLGVNHSQPSGDRDQYTFTQMMIWKYCRNPNSTKTQLN